MTALRLLVATTNTGKLAEFRSLFTGVAGLQLLSLRDTSFDEPIDEDGASFEANAQKKARIVARHCGVLTLADDSGLEVDALHGRPGVHSARFASEGASDAQNNARLLELMRDVPDSDRGARFRCVLALADPGCGPGEACHPETGACEGAILPSARRDAEGSGVDRHCRRAQEA